MADTRLEIKLLVNKERNKVVFAECDNQFVDVLFSFLTLPLGTITRLLNKQSDMGSIDALYQSVEKLDTQYFETEACKSMLLRPKSVAQNYYRNLVLNVDDSTDDHIRYYTCPTWSCSTETHCLVSMFENAICLCGNKMNKQIVLHKELIGDKEGVFSKGIRRFLISDDLQVRQVSTATGSFSIFVGFDIKDLSSLEEKTVSIGTEEVLFLLKRSHLSNTPLTDVFLSERIEISNPKIIKMEPFEIKYESLESLSDTNKYNLNLLIRKSCNKVLYAAVDQHLLDLLFGILCLPIASIMKVLRGYSSAGSIGHLYKSAEDLYNANPENFQVCNHLILNAKVAAHHQCDNNLLQIAEQSLSHLGNPKCPGCYQNNIDVCSHGKGNLLHLINPKHKYFVKESGGGFVKASSELFMVTDELVVEPLSVVSSILFVKKLGVPFDDLEERHISVGRQEALLILKAALTSKTVFTDVFCRI